MFYFLGLSWAKRITWTAKIFHGQPNQAINQRAKKVVSNSPGLVDFTTGLVKSVFNLPNGQVMFFEEFK